MPVTNLLLIRCHLAGFHAANIVPRARECCCSFCFFIMFLVAMRTILLLIILSLCVCAPIPRDELNLVPVVVTREISPNNIVIEIFFKRV